MLDKPTEFDIHVALCSKKESFTKQEAACLWLEILPKSEKGNWFYNNESGAELENPFLDIIGDPSDPFSEVGITEESRDSYNQISDNYRALRKQITAASSTYEGISRNELMVLARARSENPRFLFSDDSKNTAQQPKSLDPRKEKTLHCLIAVLANKLGYSPDNKDTVGKVGNLLEMEGVRMDKKTIRANIKEAFESLNEKRE